MSIPWWHKRYHLGRKVSQVELAVDACAYCGHRLGEIVIDAPLKQGPWAYLDPNCAKDHAITGLGTIHRNIPASRGG